MSFINDNFMLNSDTAIKLYHNYAAKLPIIDYHCHVSPREIYEDRKYSNLYEIWLEADHYKWRLMRNNGIDEYYITGKAEPFEKFKKFAESLSLSIGNPLYHWCTMELKRYFGYDGILNEDTALEVWNLANEKLKDLSARKIIEMSNVALIGTTDDPADDLVYHQKLKEDSAFNTKVIPTFRPDRALNMEKSDWKEYIDKLSEVSNVEISDLSSLKEALLRRIDYFNQYGCKSADHGLNEIEYSDFDEEAVNKTVKKRLNNENITDKEIISFKSCLIKFCAAEYKKNNWVMQLHFNCFRNPNEKMFRILGPDTGFDSVNPYDSSIGLRDLLNSLYKDDVLPKTIIYSLNKNDDLYIDTLIGSFQCAGVRGYIQHGSAWWFNDNKRGIRDQLTSLASENILGNFVGMLTDSRSFLSYTRHEYFRRILCDLIGEWVDKGEYPDEEKVLKQIIENICFYNAYSYFDLKGGK